jgi:hypothetical protein
MRRKLLITLPCLLLLVIIGGGLVHRQLVINQLETGLQAWIAERRAKGWQVQIGSITRGGLSLSPFLTIHDVDIKGGSPLIPGGVAWHASGVILKVDLFDPWRLLIHPLGLQALRLPDGSALSVFADTLEVGITAASSDGVIVDLDATGVRAELPDAGGVTTSIDLVDARIAWLPTAEPGDRVATFALSCKGLKLPAGIRWPLGPLVEVITAEGTMTGPVPDAPGPRAAALAWRDSGGSLEVAIQSLIWGPLNATGSATLALDEELQPMGAGTAHLIGYQGTLDALGGNGVLTHSAVKAAKALLSLMAGVPSGREQQAVDVPLTLQFRTLSMRQIPLALLPEMEWPGE